jgi:beta-aspartyl-peptidase (threonine type)
MTARTPEFTIAGTIRSDVGLPAGVEVLRGGGTALDAVERSIRVVEDNPDDWTVGTGGLPNLLGEVELDASIMDGGTMRAGAVAGVRRHANPITIARKVMEDTPHVLLVGDGADEFARAAGMEPAELLTAAAKDLHDDFIQGRGIVRRDYDTDESMSSKERYFESFSRLVNDHDMMEWYRRFASENHGTVNVIARDAQGNLCSGVSTSGLSFKFPGRAGDSPLIGAGNYADNRAGAAAVVGIGELAIRLSTARIAVHDLSRGATAEEAAVSAVVALRDLPDADGGFAVLVVAASGDVASACSWEGFSYWTADAGNPEPVRRECVFVDINAERQGLGYHR